MGAEPAGGELRRLAEALGFRCQRTSGSHHIFGHPRVPARLNLQDRKGQAKPYQIRQLIALVEDYNLTLAKRDR
ncbi:MAG: type II toxin-antitoxin system HicA family toxin [Rhodospirillales bacterium]|nr:type II toxin-antitoxin system HicA family toxin [Rhodospirillales bacterium]